MFNFRDMNDTLLRGELLRTHPANENYGYFRLPCGRIESGVIVWEVRA